MPTIVCTPQQTKASVPIRCTLRCSNQCHRRSYGPWSPRLLPHLTQGVHVGCIEAAETPENIPWSQVKMRPQKQFLNQMNWNNCKQTYSCCCQTLILGLICAQLKNVHLIHPWFNPGCPDITILVDEAYKKQVFSILAGYKSISKSFWGKWATFVTGCYPPWSSSCKRVPGGFVSNNEQGLYGSPSSQAVTHLHQPG